MRINNEQGHKMRSDEILAKFGLPPNGPIPADYSAIETIDGVVVHIFPRGKAPDGLKRRVLAECPKCTRFVCAGHLDQHYKIHKDK
jgi:hypothetical protein